jgi:hypothetical protein
MVWLGSEYIKRETRNEAQAGVADRHGLPTNKVNLQRDKRLTIQFGRQSFRVHAQNGIPPSLTIQFAANALAARCPLIRAPATVLAWPEVSVASPAKNNVLSIGYHGSHRAESLAKEGMKKFAKRHRGGRRRRKCAGK